MHFSYTVTLALTALASLVSAAPQSAATATPDAYGSVCLTKKTANYLVNGFASLLTAPQGPNFNSTVNAILSPQFTDTSDSINWLAGIPVGATTFPSREAFRSGQGSQPPIGFSVTEVIFTCSEVVYRWTATVGLNKFPVKGINVFSTSNLNNTQAGFQILNNFSEFNVGAWEVDINRSCSAQGANA